MFWDSSQIYERKTPWHPRNKPMGLELNSILSILQLSTTCICGNEAFLL